MEKVVIVVGLLEILIFVTSTPMLIKILYEVFERRRDSKLFFKITDDSFVFNGKSYKDNKYILDKYIQAYITYGHNVRCNLTEEEFRSNLIRFMSKFMSTYGEVAEDFLYNLLSTVDKSAHSALKCGGNLSIGRAKIILDKIESSFKNFDIWEEQEIKELVLEIKLIVKAVDK